MAATCIKNPTWCCYIAKISAQHFENHPKQNNIYFWEKKKKPDGQLVRHAVDSTSSKVTYIAFPTGTIPLEYPGVKCLALGLSDNGGSQKFSRFTDHPFPLLAKIFHCKAKANTAYDTIPKLYHMHILHCSLNKLGQTLIKSRCTTGHQ